MSRTTGISWCQKTWNPITGCTKISPGCKHCYAETMAKRLALMGVKASARYLPVIDTDTSRWTGDIRTWPEMLDAPGTPLHVRTPTTWFVGSMTDIFHPQVPYGFLADIFAVMSACPQHRFMLLTKRPDSAVEFMTWLLRRADLRSDFRSVTPIQCCRQEFQRQRGGLRMARLATHEWIDAWPLPNVAIGVSVENQECADERIPLLLDIPAHRRFLSCEPLLGPVHVDDWSGIDMVIIGCESGKGRRATQLGWIQHLGRSVLSARATCATCDGRGGWRADEFPVVGWQECSVCMGSMALGPALHIKQADVCQCGADPAVERGVYERYLINGIGPVWGCGEFGCSEGRAGKVRKDPSKPLDIYIPGYGTRTWREEMPW